MGFYRPYSPTVRLYQMVGTLERRMSGSLVISGTLQESADAAMIQRYQIAA
jgi:hypothetical protein